MDSETNSTITPIDTEEVEMTEEETATQENICIIDNVINSMIENIEYTETPKDERITKNKLTKYEFVRIMGERTKQLTMGAKPLIKINKESEEYNYNEIALEELKLGMLPFRLKRFINSNYEIWDLNELSFKHLEYLFDR